MPRSNWGIFFALVGWLSLSGQAPQPKAQPEQAEAPAQPTKSDPAVPPPAVESVKAVERPETERPCQPGQDDRNSDLCAQWKAADAAAEAAYWAKAAFWLGIVGTLGLVATLHYTRKAVLAAEEATKDADTALVIAEQNAAAAIEAAEATAKGVREASRTADAAHQANRPWLEVEMIGFEPLRIDEHGISFKCTVRVRNMGRSPATQTLIITQLATQSLEDEVIYPNAATVKMKNLIGNLSAHDNQMGSSVFPGAEMSQNHGTNMSVAEMNETRKDPNAPLLVYLSIGVRYRFGEQTAETVQSFTVVDMNGPNLAFDTRAPEHFPRLRFDDNFTGYAT